MSEPTLMYRDYTIGWICALEVEQAAARAQLDLEHPRLPSIAGDPNRYRFGSINGHNVAIVCLPDGETGNNPAATVASRMAMSFPSLKFGLMVGVGGAAPSPPLYNDIRLGDVVVSSAMGIYGGVVQYDRGKTVQDGDFRRTGSLNRPPEMLRQAVADLRATYRLNRSKLKEYLSQTVAQFETFDCPSVTKGSQDILFGPDYDHPQELGNSTCDSCDATQRIQRSPRPPGPVIHYGVVASGNRVMKNGLERDRISKELGGVLCFEMEAAGLMNTFPCLVIRGICDYSDSHKSKDWQPYAAAVAAAYAKELLGEIEPAVVEGAPTAVAAMNVWSYETILAIAVMRLSAIFDNTVVALTSRLLSSLLAVGLLAFISTKARHCMCGGLSILGMLLMPCAAFLDLVFIWCAASFSFREFIREEAIMLEGLRDLHPAGGGSSKKRIVWNYDGLHGSGEVRLFRLEEKVGGQAWEPQKFIAPAAAWVFYLDELQDEMIMNAETCVTQLYWSLWVYSLGTCVGCCSMGIAMLIAWNSSGSVSARLIGVCLSILRFSVVWWRWTADLFMSNHHRGTPLRRGNPSRLATVVSCKNYRRSHQLDSFPRAEFPPDFSRQTPGKQLKTLLYVLSQRAAKLFQNSWLDWCANHFEVHLLEAPTVKLDVRVGVESHIVTVPGYIADGLSEGTIQPGGFGWLGVVVTIAYIWLGGAQLVLFFLNGMSGISASLWGLATAAGIIGTAWLTGFPLVCSGIS